MVIIMDKYYEIIYGIMNLFKEEIEKNIPDVLEASLTIRMDDKNIKFPRVEIIPERQRVSDEVIGNGYNFWDFDLRLVPFVKSYANEEGTKKLLKITGEICDLVIDVREKYSHQGLFDDCRISSVENFFFVADNYVLYSASILVKFDVRF